MKIIVDIMTKLKCSLD